jgi:hypothetical protein
MERNSSLPRHVHRHISAARAFHSGLIADTHRRLRVLMNLARHLDVLRSRKSTPAEKAAAAETSRQHLDMFEQLWRSSRETYRDLKNAIKRIHYHLNRLTNGSVRGDGFTRAADARRVAKTAIPGRTAPSSRDDLPPLRGSSHRTPGA